MTALSPLTRPAFSPFSTRAVMAKRKKNQKSRSNNNTGGGGGGGGGGPSNHNKRPRFDNALDAAFDAPRGYVDPGTGQRGAFPGLKEHEEFYGPANDGLDYLKMVRSEAKGVPSLLIAGHQYQQFKPKEQRPPPLPHQTASQPTDELIYDDNDAPLSHDDESLSVAEPTSPTSTEEDSAGWYYDGTYTAAPLPAPSTATPQPTSLTIWHTALITRFLKLRTAFHTTPPPPSPLLVPPHLPPWRQRQYWQPHISNTKPTPGILSGMDQQITLRLIEWLTPMLKSGRGAGKGSFVGARVKGRWTEWVWGCLVKVDECLTAEEISMVRELGKRCLEVRGGMVKMREEWGEDKADEADYSENNWEYKGEAVVHEEQEEGECSEPEPVPATSTVNSNPAEISLDLDEQNDPPINPAEPEPEAGAVQLEEDDAPINIEPIPPSPPSDPVPEEHEKEHSYADTIAALDMVISIVGDFFGQKDLLLEREGQGVAKVVGVLQP